jgi:hypothetical protein
MKVRKWQVHMALKAMEKAWRTYSRAQDRYDRAQVNWRTLADDYQRQRARKA